MTIDFEAIKLQHPLIEVVEAVAGPGKQSGNIIRWNCPLPGHEERTPSFTISLDNPNRYYCFGCNRYGDVFDWIKEQHGIENLIEAVKHLTGEVVHMSDELKAQAAQRANDLRFERLERQVAEQQIAIDKLQEMQSWQIYRENLAKSEEAVELWRAEGLYPSWQTHFWVGVAPNFYAGKSLTIPVKNYASKVQNVIHRIIEPGEGGRYRPELPGLPQSLYFTDPWLGITQVMWLFEGEKKAMVARQHAERKEVEHNMQFVGAKKHIRIEDVPLFDGCQKIIYVPDPDVSDEIVEKNALLLGVDRVTIIDLIGKTDDMLIAGELDGKTMLSAGANGRKLS